MVRLFNEKVVHTPANPREHRENLHKCFDTVYKTPPATKVADPEEL